MTSKEKKIAALNPNEPGLADNNVFGLPFTLEESDIVLIPVPWEVTVSYGGGTANGPEAIYEASKQIDLYHPEFPNLWKKGIAMEEIPVELKTLSKKLRTKANHVIEALERGENPKKSKRIKSNLEKVNNATQKVHKEIELHCNKWLKKGKLVGLIGGDHSSPLGLIKAMENYHQDFGILVLDAHMDLRKAYEGFQHSHASIFYNVLQEVKAVSKLVQVGIRDNCQEEEDFVHANKNRIKIFRSAAIKKAQFTGITWDTICNEIIEQLPKKVYISVDIDGLDPKLCPNTGTPVPGGLEFEQATYLFSKLIESKKEIIGFDLCEVAPSADNDWDGNVGARMLFHLCGILSKGAAK
ncbi:MAG: agmatinase family protein [Luteibaculaceae bacterium]